jgi:hypothetical protein
VLRYYAHEMACHRDILRFKDGEVCPNAYLRTPDECRKCALEFHRPALRRMELNAWRAEYLAARAYAPEYHAVVKEALRRAKAGIVYNNGMRGCWSRIARGRWSCRGAWIPEAFMFSRRGGDRARRK